MSLTNLHIIAIHQRRSKVGSATVLKIKQADLRPRATGYRS